MSNDTDYILKNADLLTSSLQDTISKDAMGSIIRMAKKDKVKKLHPFKINVLPDGRYQTRVKLDTGARKEIRCATEDELMDYLYEFYIDAIVGVNAFSLNTLYNIWLQKKSEVTESRNTIVRHKQHYAKYFKDTEFFKRDIRKITLDELEIFCNQLVKQYQLTSKEWTNIKIILKGVYEVAIRQQIISRNLFEEMKIGVKFRQEKHKDPSDEVLTADEREKFFAWLRNKYNDAHDSAYLAPFIEFYTGARIGEIVALRWSALKGNNLHISEEETYDYETHVYSIAPHTKGHRDRYVGLISNAVEVFNVIKENESKPCPGGFVFHRGKERLTAREVTYVYEQFAKDTGVPVKRSHKLRKTFASVLDSNGVSLEIIRNQLGHRDIVTTMRYIYNPRTNDETVAIMDKALT